MHFFNPLYPAVVECHEGDFCFYAANALFQLPFLVQYCKWHYFVLQFLCIDSTTMRDSDLCPNLTGKPWLSTTMLSLMGTSRSTGRIMSRLGSINQPGKPGEELVSDLLLLYFGFPSFWLVTLLWLQTLD